ncbi:MAG: hypothetical protein LBQ34_05540 [Alphaproteobacteria bacterium]|jgi:hemerythrin-like domain-containing protein|nr:hypothetical protein [Alphaproteobacteria bacterium]
MEQIKTKLLQRLDILEASKQIDKSSKDKVLQILTNFQNYSNININKEHLEPFFTHFSLAIQRNINNNPVETMEDVIKNEIINHKKYLRLNEILAKISHDINLKFNEAESILLLSYLILIYGE